MLADHWSFEKRLAFLIREPWLPILLPKDFVQLSGDSLLDFRVSISQFFESGKLRIHLGVGTAFFTVSLETNNDLAPKLIYREFLFPPNVAHPKATRSIVPVELNHGLLAVKILEETRSQMRLVGKSRGCTATLNMMVLNCDEHLRWSPLGDARLVGVTLHHPER